MDVQRILVPLDESKLATLSLDPAYEIAKRFGARVQLLLIIDRGAEEVLSALAKSEDVSMEEAATSTLARAASDYPDVDSDVAAIFGHDPAHGIVAFANEHPIDLIVMATHGRTGVGRWLLGSVTGKVVGASSVPVVVVPAPKRRRIRQSRAE